MPLKKKNGLKMLSSYEEEEPDASDKTNSSKTTNNINKNIKLQNIKKELEKLTVKPKYIKIILKKD
jgi:hypothetical protein